MPFIEFYLNGSYFVVVQGRRMMMDEPFSETIRNSLGSLSAAGLSFDQLGGLLIELFPSALMPGYIQVRIGSYDAVALQRIDSAVSRGLISVILFHPDYFTNPASLPPTTFTAYSFSRLTLPPISRYYFYVDTSYTRVICHPDTNGFCTTNTIVKQEDLADAIRWYFQSPGFGNDPDIGNSSLVHLWPSNSSRPGIEGQIEVVATCLQTNAQLLLRLRQTVDSGQLSVFFGVSATEEEVYVAKPLPPLPGNIAGRLSLQTDIERYPGYSGVPPTGNVEVTESQNGDGDATNQAHDLAGHLQIYYSLLTTEPLSSGGLHIHNGTSCAAAGPHFYRTRNDPWLTTRWQSDRSGVASGFFDVFTGIDVNDNLGKVVVMHSSTGTRVGCGQLALVEAPIGLDRPSNRIDLSALATLSVVFPITLSGLAPAGRTAIAAAVRTRVASTAGPGLVQSVALARGSATTVLLTVRFSPLTDPSLIERTRASIAATPISTSLGIGAGSIHSTGVSTFIPSTAAPTLGGIGPTIPAGIDSGSTSGSGGSATTVVVVIAVVFVFLAIPLVYVLVFAPRLVSNKAFPSEGTDFLNPAFGAESIRVGEEPLYDNVHRDLQGQGHDPVSATRDRFSNGSGDYAEIGAITDSSSL